MWADSTPEERMSDPTLIVETSGRAGQVGLAVGGAVIRTVTLDGAKRHARDLTSSISEMLTDAGLTPKELGRVFVSVGPGGYTGLRVGLMTAKTIAYTVGCPLVAVPTFTAIAEQAPTEAERVAVCADALQGLVYWQPFIKSEGRWCELDSLRIDPASDRFPSVEPHTWVSGPGLAGYEDRLPSGAKVVNPADRTPRVESVYAVGCRLAPVTRDELLRLEPLYLRGSSAEEKAKATT
jgi:tRNA threonylcarbamoyladenosine biosynthesis protein TsaB